MCFYARHDARTKGSRRAQLTFRNGSIASLERAARHFCLLLTPDYFGIEENDRNGPVHKVAALQPPARGQEPRAGNRSRGHRLTGIGQSNTHENADIANGSADACASSRKAMPHHLTGRRYLDDVRIHRPRNRNRNQAPRPCRSVRLTPITANRCPLDRLPAFGLAPRASAGAQTTLAPAPFRSFSRCRNMSGVRRQSRSGGRTLQSERLTRCGTSQLGPTVADPFVRAVVAAIEHMTCATHLSSLYCTQLHRAARQGHSLDTAGRRKRRRRVCSRSLRPFRPQGDLT